jgi:hypothetical protein
MNNRKLLKEHHGNCSEHWLLYLAITNNALQLADGKSAATDQQQQVLSNSTRFCTWQKEDTEKQMDNLDSETAGRQQIYKQSANQNSNLQIDHRLMHYVSCN